ncbi:uncharacterized protein BJ171DRAFT_496553 [Polychytrium aggregatum]|uniref:uncharacterized protein n=1 Tax=Polychytrium aggregatum TaxID=110093 RepID=UPI0022FEE206|nr:uncharacterized protein BJ171DRAFT_496553 [Polychytrium aggregatum]KAI9206668.1 hypothetical protein BJ171DRAFT_496553 [Polychytrium aggregatum]
MSPTNSVPENKAPAPGADGAAGNEADEFGLSQGFILDEHQKFLKVFKASPLANVVTAIQSVLTPPNMGSAVAVEGLHSSSVALRHICPLLKQYLAAAEYRMCELMVYHKSINKLAYILCNTFALLLKNGFCVPQASDDSAEGETEDNVDGTGIGEGEGNKDVSDQIDNPEQVEGTQNEQKQQPSGEPVPEEENALEMDEDFDGQIEDVKREAGDDDDDKDDDDEEENDAAEEQMGELDRDEADVVDEKLWGDDDDDQIDKDNEKTEKNASVDSKGGETETVAKDESGPDDEQPPEPKDEAEKREQDSKRNADNGSEASDDESDHVNDIEDAFEDSHGVDIKDRDQPEEPDGDDDMDLPEDMNLDGDGDENENENDDDDDGHNDMEIDRPDDDAKPRDDEKNVGDNGDADSSDEEAADEADDGEGDDHVDQIEDQLDESPTEQPGDRSDNDESSQQPDEPEEPEEPEAPDEAADPANNSMQPHGGEDPAADEQDESEAKEDDTKAVDDREQSRAEQPHGVEGQAGQVSNIQSSEPTTGEGTGADNQAADDSFEHADASEAKPTQRPAASQQQKQKPRKPDPNPRRSLGDALKNWMSRLKSISESSQDRAEEPQQSEQNEQPQVDGDQAMDYEFVQNDDEAADAQALDAATSEQMSQMDQKALADDEEEDNYAKQDEEMQVDDQPAEETPAFEKKPDQRSNDNQNVSGTLPNRQKESDDSADAETRPAGEDLAADEDHDDGDGDDARDNLASTDDQSRRQRQDPQSDEDMGDTSDEHDEAELSYEELRQNLEKSVADWRQSGQDLREAETLWKNYTNLTQNLAFELCEQLRLILEPTLATKLKGDYRTGKRLNMRKVIPYIASQFKKDKIWMRRTKPSKRTYQILIAIDDSQSMAETRSVQMAYESLALISKALTQLEVGDLGIVSFGESVRLVHPFERPFSDDAGAEVLRRFTFSQGRTNVRTMMDTAIEVLDHARLVTATAPGADELWQLQIIISDGICEDHEKIKALVRKAAENRIMVVFLVLDNRPEKDSIVKMTNVTYGTDSKTGRPTLQMSKYMDTFPFDYYVMLRDINRLPEVLSDTLRQYFSFVSA